MAKENQNGKGSTKKRIVLASIILVLGAGAYSLLWGRLAPLSPVVAGFDRRVSPKAIVHFHKGTSIPEAGIVDGLVERVEAWHGLRFATSPRPSNAYSASATRTS